MKNVKLITLGGVLAGFTVVFQSLPAFLSEMFVVLTVFSALPIYIMCRMSPLAGISTFISALILISIISPHEGVFFLFTNGIIGTGLGLIRYNLNNKLIPIILTSIILTAALSFLSIPLGVNVFGVCMPFAIWLQLVFVLLFSIVYCTTYIYFAEFIYTHVKTYLKFD